MSIYLCGPAVQWGYRARPNLQAWLKDARLIKGSFNPPIVHSKCTSYLLQGPFATDSEAVANLRRRLEFLTRVGFLSSRNEYRSARVVLQDAEHPELAWVMYGSGEELGADTPVSTRLLEPYWEQRNCFDWPESAAQLLAVLMLQRLVGAPTNLSALLYSWDRISMFGLEVTCEAQNLGLLEGADPHSREARARAALVGFLRTHADLTCGASDLSLRKPSSSSVPTVCVCGTRSSTTLLKMFSSAVVTRILSAGAGPSPKDDASCSDFAAGGGGGKLWPGVMLKAKDHRLHSTLDPKVVCTLYRSVKPFEGVRTQFSDVTDQLCDVLRIQADDVRPMSEDEHQEFGDDVALEDLGRMRRASLDAFFLGDLVTVYEHDVHNENLNTHERRFDQDAFERLKPVDVGLVIGTDWNWRTVYLFKAKTTRAVQCSKLFWLPDRQSGRAVAVPRELLDELAPRAVMVHNLKLFEHLL